MRAPRRGLQGVEPLIHFLIGHLCLLQLLVRCRQLLAKKRLFFFRHAKLLLQSSHFSLKRVVVGIEPLNPLIKILHLSSQLGIVCRCLSHCSTPHP